MFESQSLPNVLTKAKLLQRPASVIGSPLLPPKQNCPNIHGRPTEASPESMIENVALKGDCYNSSVEQDLMQMLHSALQKGNKLQFVFGYGSLISVKSRQRTIPSASIGLPVTVNGFRRSWGYRCPKKKYTAVAVHRSKEASTNGVLIPLAEPEAELPRLDEREKYYHRGIVALDCVEFMDHRYQQLLHSYATHITIWVYEILDTTGPFEFPPFLLRIPLSNASPRTQPMAISRKRAGTDSSACSTHDNQPCRHCPIPQSYIDCILSGCIQQFGPAFAKQFIATTHGWRADAWLNDRHACVSKRKYVQCSDTGESVSTEMHYAVDVLLESLLPNEFDSRIEL